MKYNWLVLFLLGATFLVSCSKGSSNDWKGFIYPSEKELIVGDFESLEECRRYIITIIADVPDFEGAGYECGRNCKKSGDSAEDFFICEETSD